MAAKQRTRAMGFFQTSDAAKAAAQAIRFAGDGGRIGTMLDVVDARLATTIGSNAWERYWTTASWELRGRSRGGVELLAVHHGGGPLGTPNGMAEAYARSTREDVGARVPQEMFQRFLDGAYGPVEVVELAPYLKRYRFPFLGILTYGEAADDPVLRARLGPRAGELLRKHRQLAEQWCDEQRIERSWYLLQVESPGNCGYPYRKLPDDWAFAHMLVIDQPMNLSHVEEEPERKGWRSLVVEVGCHERSNAVRMLGIRGGDPIIGDLHSGIAALGDIGRNWRRLMQPVRGQRPRRDFVNLIRYGRTWFSQHPMGDGVMMSNEPEFRVVDMTPVEGPDTFRTEILGYHGLFKYEEPAVRALAPNGANAYAMGEPTIEWSGGNPTHHVAPIKWFRVVLNTDERIPRGDELADDIELQLRLLDAA